MAGDAVALKVLRRLEDERARACFGREARVLAALRLPSVPAIFEVGEARGAPYIAMELIDGETLAAAPKPIEARRAAALTRDAARTVQQAHEAGVLHRDLKPGNSSSPAAGRGSIEGNTLRARAQ